MTFKDTYTTSDKVLAEASIKPDDLPKDYKFEKDKTVLSNDAYAIGLLLECLINKGLR